MSKGLRQVGKLLRAAAFAAAFGVYPADAQLTSYMPNSSSLNTGSNVAMSAAVSEDLPLGYVRDVISGNKSRGPYMLSWKGIPASRESVIIDGRHALRDIDYAIDYGKGQISFTNALGATSMARVEYPVHPDKSSRNSSAFTLPLTLDLYNSGDSSLQFTTLYRQGAKGASRPGDAIFGLSGTSKPSDRTSITTAFYMAPGADGGLGEGSAAKFGVAQQLGSGLKLTGSYERAGQSFSGSKDYGLKSGQDAQRLALAWQPAGSRLTVDTSYLRQDSSGGSPVTSLQQNLGYNLGAGAKFLFSRQSVERDSGDSSSTAVRSTYQLSSTLGPKTSAQFTWADVSDSASSMQTRTQLLSVNSSLLANVAVKASFKATDATDTGAASAVDVGITAKPIAKVEVHASFAGRDSDALGVDNSGEIRVAAVPNSRLRVSVGMAERQTAAQGTRSRDVRLDARPLEFLSLNGGLSLDDTGASTTVVRDLSASAKPWTFLIVDGMYKNRDLGLDDLNSSRMSLTLSPWEFLGITAAMEENPEDKKGAVQYYDSRSLGLKASVGILSLTGSYAFRDEYLAAREWFQTQVGMGIRLARATQLTGGYEYSETAATVGLSSRRLSVGLKRDLGRDFNLLLSGSRLDRESAASLQTDTSYEAQVSLGVRF